MDMTKAQLIIELKKAKEENRELKRRLISAEKISVEQFKRMQIAEQRARDLWHELVMANESET